LVFDLCLHFSVAIAATLASASSNAAPQERAISGKFVLHKFAKAIGTETYSIENKGDAYTLTSHFLFTDRGSPVPLEATFVARAKDMAPRSYSAKGRASRLSAMDDVLTVSNSGLTISRGVRRKRILQADCGSSPTVISP
jgi:hypothetical protein